MMHIEEDTETVGVLDLDPGLRPYKDHFGYRMKKYISQKKLIENYEGSLEDFAQGIVGKSAHTRQLCFSFRPRKLSEIFFYSHIPLKFLELVSVYFWSQTLKLNAFLYILK